MTGPRHQRLASADLYLIATGPAPDAGPAPWEAWTATLARAAEAGVELIQLRLKSGGTDHRRQRLAEVRGRVGARTLLIVNDDLEAVRDAAGRTLADGLHLGRHDAEALAGPAGDAGTRRAAGLARARRVLGPDLLLGTSTRTLAEIALAREAGCDHVGFGAMAVTHTKAHTHPADPAELGRARERWPDLPIFPIGGLGPHNLGLCRAQGVHRAAIGSALLDAPDVAAAVAACRAALAG